MIGNCYTRMADQNVSIPKSQSSWDPKSCHLLHFGVPLTSQQGQLYSSSNPGSGRNHRHEPLEIMGILVRNLGASQITRQWCGNSEMLHLSTAGFGRNYCYDLSVSNFNTEGISVYSTQCVYESIYQFINTWYIWTSCSRCFSNLRCAFTW